MLADFFFRENARANQMILRHKILVRILASYFQSVIIVVGGKFKKDFREVQGTVSGGGGTNIPCLLLLLLHY